MSWRVDGKYYHNYEAYQRALARKRSRESDSHFRALDRELNAARNKHEKAKSELKKVNGDLKEQRRVNAQLEQTQREMARIQSDLVRSQNQLRDQMLEIDHAFREEFSSVLNDMSALENRIQVDQASMQHELETAQTELAQAIEQVDQRLQTDLQTRMASQTDQMARASVQIEAATDVLSRLNETHLDDLDLIDRHSEISSKIKAFQLLGSEDSQAALAVGLDIFEKTRSLQEETQRRQSMLEATREAILNEADYLTEMVDLVVIQRFFRQELALFQTLLDQLKTRAQNAYQHFRELSVQGREDQRLLAILRRQAYRMVSSVDVLEEQQNERIKVMRDLVQLELPKLYGTLSSKPEQAYLIPEDIKSPVRVSCDFGGAKVQVILDIDGSIQLDGYGHDSNVTCRQQGERTFDALQSIFPEGTKESRPLFSLENRQAPLSTDIKVTDEWADIHRDLQSEIEQARRGNKT